MIALRFSDVGVKHIKHISKDIKNTPSLEKKITQYPFSKLPWQDLKILTDNIHLAERHAAGMNTIALIGMGGSTLGAQALTAALSSHLKRRIVFIDNIDPDTVWAHSQSLNPTQTFFIFISKSGGTIEVRALADFFVKGKKVQHCLVISDRRDTPLARFAHENNIPVITSEADIPGRFSVLATCGLLPAALTGIPVKQVLKGARQTSIHDATALALHQYRHYKNGKNICVFFSYNDRLRLLGDWYTQLLAESIGKSKKIGITPARALGVHDQHAQLQLFMDGPDDKFFLFLKAKSGRHTVHIPGRKFSFDDLFTAEYKGVVGALEEKKKVLCEITFASITPEIIGELFFLFELEVAALGDFFDIDAFDQPGVELSKKKTQTLIKWY